VTAPGYQFREIHGQQMAYQEFGSGEPIVFLHGNPTSSYLWRQVIPALQDQARCIAPDLIGMGKSTKLPAAGPDTYSFAEHRRYLDGLLDSLDLGDSVTLVVHDWGSALGFDWARRHPERVRGIAYMEAIVRPVTWAEWPESARTLFQAFRSPAGEDLVLQKNMFIERVLPASIMRTLSDEEMAAYREPYGDSGEGRWPTLSWPRQLPIDGEPANIVDLVKDYAVWLTETEIPKLFINAEPGAILTGSQRRFCRSWPNQTEVTVKGIHFIQEDSGPAIGGAIADWYHRLD